MWRTNNCQQKQKFELWLFYSKDKDSPAKVTWRQRPQTASCQHADSELRHNQFFSSDPSRGQWPLFVTPGGVTAGKRTLVFAWAPPKNIPTCGPRWWCHGSWRAAPPPCRPGTDSSWPPGGARSPAAGRSGRSDGRAHRLWPPAPSAWPAWPLQAGETTSNNRQRSKVKGNIDINFGSTQQDNYCGWQLSSVSAVLSLLLPLPPPLTWVHDEAAHPEVCLDISARLTVSIPGRCPPGVQQPRSSVSAGGRTVHVLESFPGQNRDFFIIIILIR